MRFTVLALAAIVWSGAFGTGCARGAGEPARPKGQPKPVYDKQTGKLTMVTLDSKGDGKIDTWSHMDGARIVRIEADRDGDGRVDRWEYYGADQKVEKIGMSRANDGDVDAWAYPSPDGGIARMDISTKRDGQVTRREFYEAGALVRAEEDTQGAGRIDKWETYRDGGLAMVALDDRHRGVPTRRLVYLPGGQVRVEVDPQATGNFVPAPAK